jgi:chaperonin GroES
MPRIRPLHDNVVVRRIDPEKTSKGGIIIPDNAKEKQTEGIVVAVGPGRWSSEKVATDPGTRHEKFDYVRQPIAVGVGDRILFGKYTGTEVRVEGQELLIVNELEILGVVEGSTS